EVLDAFIKERIKDFGAYRTKVMVPPLLEFLHGKGLFAAHVDDEAQVLAVRALSQIGGPEVVAGLVEYLTAKKGFLGLGKGNEEVEAAACNALGRIGDPAAEKALNKCLKSKFKKVQSAASVALKRMQEAQSSPATTVMAGEPAEAAPTVFAAAAPDEPTQIAFADEPTPMGSVAEQPTQFELDEATVPPGEPEPTVPPHESFTTPSVDDLIEMTVMGDADNVPVSVVLTVGPIVVDNIRVCLPGVDDEGKLTADQRGAQFVLEPGKYEVLIRDQGMAVTKVIQVEAGMSEVRLDLQDIFNF
ncbi:MAG TPA: HEAT repeat domain-containing protein, partial [bacterium]|nr:HEAT repeat domain-containing protein [bacterium]